MKAVIIKNTALYFLGCLSLGILEEMLPTVKENSLYLIIFTILWWVFCFLKAHIEINNLKN